MSSDKLMPEVSRCFLITGSDEICEIVALADLHKAVHDMFCCCGASGCDNGYFEAFKEEFGDGTDFEGWRENLEDGWLNVEELPAQPKQIATLIAERDALREAAKGAEIMIGFLLEYAECHPAFEKVSKRNANVTRVKLMDALEQSAPNPEKEM